MLNSLSLASHHAQRARLFHWHKLNSGLLQYPRFNFDVPHPQQVERAADVVLFPNPAGLVSLYLCGDSGGHLYPLAQAGKAPAQPVKAYFQTSGGAYPVVCRVRVCQVSTGSAGA